jgi:hypothetical protein
MPGYRGHLAGGALFYVLALLVLIKSLRCAFSDQDVLIGLVMCLLGSLFPDIDIKSKGQKLFYTCFLGVLLLALYYNNMDLFIMGSLACFVPLLSRHRGVSHRYWFIVIVPLLIPFALQQMGSPLQCQSFMFYGFFVLGALSHLVFDFGARRVFRKVLWRLKRR